MSKGPFYYTLITAEIVFQLPEDPMIYTAHVNGVLSDKHPEITARLIGKAQQIAQLQFHKQLEVQQLTDQEPKVLTVVILNLAPLGRMTEAEFQGIPQGDKPVVVPASLDDPFNSI
jgi:hypothetical protein